jgi:hypothetical protein
MGISLRLASPRLARRSGARARGEIVLSSLSLLLHCWLQPRLVSRLLCLNQPAPTEATLVYRCLSLAVRNIVQQRKVHTNLTTLSRRLQADQITSETSMITEYSRHQERTHCKPRDLVGHTFIGSSIADSEKSAKKK